MGVDDSYTKSLLHMDGADESTTFTDESGKTWTVTGAVIDTAQSVFGGASGFFNGDVIDTPDHDDWNIGSGDFTVDFRMRPAAINQSAFICAQAASNGADNTLAWYVYISPTETVEGGIISASTYYTAKTAASAYAANTWYHVALIRYGNDLKIYLDGTVGATVADVTGVTANNSAYKLAIGRLGEYNGLYYNGHIDEWRFSKGIARWTADFTPPSAAYSGTKIATINGVTYASVKTVNGIARASVKSINGIS